MINRINAIDFHAHILPNADHGSSGSEMTAEQLTLMEKIGVDTVVATPHFYPNRHTVEYFERKIEDCVREINELDIKRPQICLGAEVLYYEGMDNMEGLNKLCIRGTDILLLELPFSSWDISIVDTVKRLTKKHTVLLAHIDRYIDGHSDEIDAMLYHGALAQINTASLFSFSMKKKVLEYVKSGCVYAIGSDLHEVDKKTCKQFAEAYKRLGDEYESIMTRSEELLKNAERI